MGLLSRWRFWFSVNPLYWNGLLGLTCVLLILAYHLRLLPWEKFALDIQSKEDFYSGNICIYYDFDHDGFSELFRIKIAPEVYEPAVVVHAHNGGVIDQWNFAEPVLQNRIFFGDYDGDNADEVFVITRGQDSLFLYVFSPRQPSAFILYRQFLLRAPQPNPHPAGLWDIQHCSAAFLDRDGDGFKEIYLCLQSGLSRSPRGIYCYDIRQKRMVAISKSGEAYFSVLRAVDFDGDGSPELLPLKALTPGNSDSQKVIFSDYSAWFMAFNHMLQFQFPPVAFPNMGSSLQVVPLWQNGKRVILVLHNYNGYLNLMPSLHVFNSQGKPLLEKELNDSRSWLLCTDQAYSHAFLLSPDGKLSLLRPDLSVLKSMKLPEPLVDVALVVDLNGDLADELIGVDTHGRLCIVDWKSGSTAVVPIAIKHRSRARFSVYQVGKKTGHLVVWTPEKSFVISLVPNPFYAVRWYLLIVAGTVLFFLFKALADALLGIARLQALIQHILDTGWQPILLFDHLGHLHRLSLGTESDLGIKERLEPGERVEDVFSEQPDLRAFVLAGWQSHHPAERLIHQSRVRLRRFTLGSRLLKLGVVISLTREQEDGPAGDFYRQWSRTVQKLAHDIKTPMSAIQLNLQTLRWKLESHSQELMLAVEEDFTLIAQELQRVRQLTKNFLKFANLETPRFEPVYLAELVTEALEPFQGFFNDHLQLDMELDCDQEWVLADPEQMKMLLRILVENAIDAMEGRGRILISSSCSDSLEQPGQKFLEIEVADSGPGIPADLLHRVFEPYFTTKPDGIGLGLALARKIVLDHGGQISIYSREGFSTVVKILLPMHQNVARKECHES